VNIGIILVHGYLGSAEGLSSLNESLLYKYDNSSIVNIQLPGHEDKNIIPKFNIDSFVESINSEIKKIEKESKKIVLIGHSTGGVFILSALLKYKYNPLLVVLASTPFKIDYSYFERWGRHINNNSKVSFTDVSNMILSINKTCSNYNADHSILVINGNNDELVPVNELLNWESIHYRGNIRTVTIPNGTHSLFSDSSKRFSIDVIKRAISDIEYSGLESRDLDEKLSLLTKFELEANDFISHNPFSRFNITRSPSFKQLINEDIKLEKYSIVEPIIANIEITNYCNLECKYCFRTKNKLKHKHMSLDSFKQILDLLPHSYRINLVGLGEPLLHPEIIKFIEYAIAMKRRVSIVTNASLLNEKMSKQLISAGLNSIAFSIDYFDQESADKFRNGTDFNQVINNIRNFMIVNKNNRISTAVFSAVSIESLTTFNLLVELILALNIKVLMLTDLNYEYNKPDSLNQHVNKEHINLIRDTVKYAFSKNLIMLTVRGLEAFCLQKNYKDFLLLPPDQLYKRSLSRTYCFSPWQTIPVNVNGDISICDCMPENKIGNIFKKPFSEIWNGEKMMTHRKNMIGNYCPKACRDCPRF
jgi:radical SAM protein with 4Fe4S-binding SPASM domain